jgi:small subunit ribosomal protein S21
VLGIKINRGLRISPKIISMLIIKIKEGENIDRAIKRYRKKHRDTKLIREIRGRQEFKKASVIKRETMMKAQYRERLMSQDL